MSADKNIDLDPTAAPVDEAASEPGRHAIGLTVLFHPDVGRIGDIVCLLEPASNQQAPLSRSEPDFIQPGGQGRNTGPLASRVLSREPIVFVLQDNGNVSLSLKAPDIHVVADGSAVNERAEFSREEIEAGVVLELSRRIVLLLHMLDPSKSRQQDPELIGQSKAIQQVLDEIDQVADLSVPVLLRGESGVGKELVARAIHNRSGHGRGPYVAVNMAAIPESMAAAELFGYTAGAFTGATREHRGYFEQADRGTLFLDEVGDTPGDVQIMLHRAIEQREIQMIGGTRRRKVDVRLISATDSDLERAIEKGEFREALKQRLQEYEIRIPPLRDRREDIGRLFIHFLREQLDEINELNRLQEPEAGKPTWPPASFVARLARARWPGNVRQLRTLARRVVIANRGKPAFQLNDAIERLLQEAGAPTEKGEIPSAPPVSTKPSKRPPSDIREEELRALLRQNDYRVRPVADELGVSPTSVYTLMDRFKIPVSHSLGEDQIKQAMAACQGDIDMAAEKLEVSGRGLRLRMKELGISTAPPPDK